MSSPSALNGVRYETMGVTAVKPVSNVFFGSLFASVGSSQTGYDSVGPISMGFWRCSPCTTSGAADTELEGCCEGRRPEANVWGKAGGEV